MRVNWLAVIVSAIALFLFGYLWYGLLFGKMWTAEMAKINPQLGTTMASEWYPFVVTFVMGIFSAYGIARALAWRGDSSLVNGAFIGLSLGLLIFGSMTWLDYAYSHFGVTLGFINVGYVVIGMAIQGAILGAWKLKSAH
jgi:hypothetical protein